MEGLVPVPIFPPGHRVNGVLCLVNRAVSDDGRAEIDGVTAFMTLWRERLMRPWRRRQERTTSVVR
jgi:hypothetical protein